MAKLERLEAIAETGIRRPPPSWGISQRLFVLGAVVFLVGVLVAVVFAVPNRPARPMPDFTPELVQRWPALYSVMKFQQARREGLERGISPRDDVYNQKLSIYHAWLGVSLALVLSGTGLIAIGMAYRRAPSPRKDERG